MDADRQSFEAYVRARGPGLSRQAYLLTGNHHLAEDLVQQTLLRVAGRWRRVVAGGDPDPYVRRVLYHQHVSWWRRRARQVPEAPLEGTDRPVPDEADSIAVTLAVQAALARLAPRQRAAIVLRYFADLSEAQIAATLGCRAGTVKSQLRDGLARLKVLAPELAELLEVRS
ncbi:SigE family RNA polymerase sigma factor [Micromonospora sp. 15K316]|uniref:SigE family RNA polymerase sigma factor n=1 Tax=Micromonospora sp. 15K316 TaxID=2530376 RepID=UPI00104C83FD|nr:SigE family RNA polymerase sigma factor [Micromonospora sp. 15K316]TDC39411.1 SigE family RNA polymerase sigma factor [Micromonospora sp. 15K316]